MSTQEWAHRYASLGWKVFPVTPDKTPLVSKGVHAASSDKHQIDLWWERYPGAGIGVATGSASGILVLDVDDKPGSIESVAQLIKDYGTFEQSVVSRTGGGGYHFFFAYPQGIQRVANAVGLHGLVGIDIRGDGGYVVVPPSPHYSGNMYEWGEGQSPFDGPLPPAPVFITASRSKKTRSLNFLPAIPEGERNSTLASIAGTLRALGFTEERLIEALLDQNQRRCHPPLPADEVERIARAMAQTPPYPSWDSQSSDEAHRLGLQRLLSFDRTDVGFSEMISFFWLGKLKYNHDTGRWLLWKEHWWEEDHTLEVLQRVIHLIRIFYQAIDLVTEEDQRNDALKYARQIQQLRKMDQALKLTSSHTTVASVSSHWDTDGALLGVTNGVVDLRTGELRNGNPDHLISQHCPVVYCPEQSAPRWMQFLKEILGPDLDLHLFIQRAVGYSLTSETREQCLFLLVGSGSNGKSVFLDVLNHLFGDYSYISPFSTFERTMNGSSAQSNDLAALSGKRLVIASETRRGTTFDDARLKAISGGEKLTARFLHREFFTFHPTAKLWLGMNHLPHVRDDSEGFWRRVRRVDFTAVFDERTSDKNLKEYLKTNELPGILNWAVQGARDWWVHGLPTPPSVRLSTDQYRHDTDPILDFYQDCCIRSETGSVIWSDLYVVYTSWAGRLGLLHRDILSVPDFQARLGRDFRRDLEETKRYWGVQLKSLEEYRDKIQSQSEPIQVVFHTGKKTS